jgi:hypothetical protein
LTAVRSFLDKRNGGEVCRTPEALEPASCVCEMMNVSVKPVYISVKHNGETC